MRPVTWSMHTSLDGYVVGPDGGFDWAVPSAEVFDLHVEELRGVAVHLLGRRLYETMRYWETAQDLDGAEREWARLWTAMPKVVFSRTLTGVEGTNTRLARGTVAEEIARLRVEADEGEIAVGGADLAASIAAEGLIDEYRPVVHPVLVGGGTPFFPRGDRHVDLELVAARTFDGGVVAQRYRVLR